MKEILDNDLTYYILKLLRKTEHWIRFNLPDPSAEVELYKTTANHLRTYTLPDGQELELGTERFLAPEILFDPGILGLKKPNIAEIIHRTIERWEQKILLVMKIFNNVISRFTLRSIASLITISSQCILTLQSTIAGLNQNNTSERQLISSSYDIILTHQHNKCIVLSAI